MMVEARKMCDDYKRHNVSRKKKRYKNIVFFPEPEEFLKQASSKTIRLTRKAHQGGDVISAEEFARYTLMLEQDSKSTANECFFAKPIWWLVCACQQDLMFQTMMSAISWRRLRMQSFLRVLCDVSPDVSLTWIS